MLKPLHKLIHGRLKAAFKLYGLFLVPVLIKARLTSYPPGWLRSGYSYHSYSETILEWQAFMKTLEVAGIKPRTSRSRAYRAYHCHGLSMIGYDGSKIWQLLFTIKATLLLLRLSLS